MKPSDVLGCAGATLLLLLFSQLIPVVGLLPGVLIPQPFIFYSIRLGSLQGAKVAAATFLIVFLTALLGGFPRATLLCIELGVLGLFLAELYRRRRGIGRTVLLGTAALVLMGLILLLAVGLPIGKAPWTLILDYFRSNLNETVRSYEGMGLGPEGVARLREYGQRIGAIVERVYPSLLVTGAAVVVWVNVLVSRRVLRMRDLPAPEYEPLDRWRSPEGLVWGFIGAGFAFFLPWSGVRFVAVNALVVIASVYTFHGLAILQFYLKKLRFPRFLRLVAYLIILMQQILLVGLALAGLFDQWIDFRKISRNQAIPHD
jgi:uncharacterized protein YybS (DUF2232 family)